MNRARRTRILVEGPEDLARDLADTIRRAYVVVPIEEPKQALVMAKVRETACASLFYLGDVLVTEAKCRVGDAVGIGIVAGDAPERAGHLAVIDAACNAGLPEVDGWWMRLEAEQAILDARHRSEHERVERTRVVFESLDVTTGTT